MIGFPFQEVFVVTASNRDNVPIDSRLCRDQAHYKEALADLRKTYGETVDIETATYIRHQLHVEQRRKP